MNDKLGEVLETVKLLAQRASGGDYIFRGEPRCYEKVSSSLYRQYPNIEAGQFHIEVVQKEILEGAKKYTPETDEFEILTQLQHFGGKTNLIDFTTDCFTALFFACDGLPGEDGRVILLQKSGAMSGQVSYPHNPTNRVIAQKSVFVRPPKGFVEPDDIFIIRHELKQSVLEYLRTSHGISSETIYNDLHGFIRVQDIHKSAYTKFYEARTFQLKGQYPQAIEYYSQALELDPQLSPAYNNRGNTHYHMSDFVIAIQDYDRALEIDPRYADAYNNRGNAYKASGDLAHAIQDYNRSLELDLNIAETYYNRGNAYRDMGETALAIEDYSKVVEMNEGQIAAYALFNRAIARLCLSEWEAARGDLAILRSMGMALVKALTSVGYEEVTDFQNKNGVELPADIIELLSD